MDPTTLLSVGVAGVFTLAVYMCCSLPLQIQIKNASPSQIVALTKVMYTVCRIIVLDKLHTYFGFVTKTFESKDNNKNNNNNKDEVKKLSKKPRSLQFLPPSGLLGPNTTKVHPPLPPSPLSPPSPPPPSPPSFPSFPPPDIDSQEINSPILNTRMNLNEMQFENDLIDLGQY